MTQYLCVTIASAELPVNAQIVLCRTTDWFPTLFDDALAMLQSNPCLSGTAFPPEDDNDDVIRFHHLLGVLLLGVEVEARFRVSNCIDLWQRRFRRACIRRALKKGRPFLIPLRRTEAYDSQPVTVSGVVTQCLIVV